MKLKKPKIRKIKKKKNKPDKHSSKEVKRVMKYVKRIERLQDVMGNLTDEELQQKTLEFKERLSNGESLDKLMVEAFAVVREADKRVLGKEPYRVQLIGAVLLHQGRVAELKTGEGKTLLGTMPAYLNALTGKGVHIVTVNEYLAQRDSDEMRQVHEFLGLTVGCVTSSMKSDARRVEYGCDITYVTNSEVGFDYLRDNMVIRKEDKVQRGLEYAIIDEVDSVLIDDAKTPLIISGASQVNTIFYGTCDILAKTMNKANDSDEENGDFIVDEKDRVITLTDKGLKKAEQFLHVENISSVESKKEYHGVLTALRANHLMHRDKDYIVKDDEVKIVDESTGRVMDGHRYADGLHQAIEAKERVTIQKETHTQATITYQNFFNKYKKKSGMTGTGKTEEKEFREIYFMDVVQVPTNKPVIRNDLPDLVFKTKKEKFEAVCEAVKESYMKHQPVLVGTVDIKTSENLSRMLSQQGIPHYVLNAKNDKMEAMIVSHAGEPSKVTIATNMAGRGTDIKLTDESKELGGLKVIGTERHESRRIDDQLRGRSGRQGDPGESQFYLSLEDRLMRFFAKDRWLAVLEKSKSEYSQSITHRKLSKAVTNAQKHIEWNNFGIRKQTFEYDTVISSQRDIVYAERDAILEKTNVSSFIRNMVSDFISSSVYEVLDTNNSKKWDLQSLNEKISTVLLTVQVVVPRDVEVLKNRKELISLIEQRAGMAYQTQIEMSNSEDLFRFHEKRILLSAIDDGWKSHLENMERLKQWIGVQSYGQKDPRFEYKRLGNDFFKDMFNNIQQDVLKEIFSNKERDVLY